MTSTVALVTSYNILLSHDSSCSVLRECYPLTTRSLRSLQVAFYNPQIGIHYEKSSGKGLNKIANIGTGLAINTDPASK